jgi:hypothetical protein
MRNEGKLRARDLRARKDQALEFSPFAPDTAEEIIAAIGRIEAWMEAAGKRPSDDDAIGNSSGGAAGNSSDGGPRELELPKRTIENSSRSVVLKRPRRALAAYREMLLWYAGCTVLNYAESFDAAPGSALDGTASRGAQGDARSDAQSAVAALEAASQGGREREWENLGGQLVGMAKLEALLAKARSGELRDWNAMHAEYARLSAEYPTDKAAHAWATLLWLYGTDDAGRTGGGLRGLDLLDRALGELCALSERVEAEVFATRAKDFHNPFRKATFRSEAEMLAVEGRPEENPFVKKTARDMAELRERAARLREALIRFK